MKALKKLTLIAVLAIVSIAGYANTISISTNNNPGIHHNPNFQTFSQWEGHGCHAHMVTYERYKIWQTRTAHGYYGCSTESYFVWSQWRRIAVR